MCKMSPRIPDLSQASTRVAAVVAPPTAITVCATFPPPSPILWIASPAGAVPRRNRKIILKMVGIRDPSTRFAEARAETCISPVN